MVEASYTVKQLRKGGFTAGELHAESFAIGELRGVYSVEEMRRAGYLARELAEAHFKPSELIGGGFTLDHLRDEALFTVAALKQDSLPAKALRAAGYSVSDLAESSIYSLREIVDGGYEPASLRVELELGVQQLLDADISPAEVVRAGYSTEELQAAGDVATLRQAGVSTADLAKAGFSVRSLVDGGLDLKALKRELGIGAERLRNEDYRADECRAVGYSLMELKSAGFAVAELKDAAYAASELRTVGFSATALATAGFTPRELIQGSYPLSVLNAELHCSVSDLKSQGFGVGELKVRDGVLWVRGVTRNPLSGPPHPPPLTPCSASPTSGERVQRPSHGRGVVHREAITQGRLHRGRAARRVVCDRRAQGGLFGRGNAKGRVPRA